uniref:G protein-coupled receptor n=1 Tax=Caenorhabditis japonica TaxID=281687 RepID=A0A8R1IAV9_CAEJA
MDIAISVLHSSFAVFGIINNSLLIILALFKSPRVLRIFSILILSHAITDLGICIIDLFNQARLIPCDYTIAFISNGLCRFFGSSFCFAAQVIELHFLTHSLYLILLSFCYRLYVLHRPAPRIKVLIFIILIVYIPSLFMVATLLTNPRSDYATLEKLVLKRFPTYNVSGAALNGYEDLTQFAPLFSTLHSIIPTFPIYVTILVLRKRIIVTLAKEKQYMGPETREIHSQLLKALSIQALLPGIVCLSIICFLLGQMRILNHPLLEYLTFLIVLIVPSFSPLICLIYIRPYRKAILRVVCPKLGKVKPKASGNSM